MCIGLLPLVLVNFIRELRVLAALSTVGNILIIISFAVILYSLVSSPNEILALPAITPDPARFTIGIGAMLYCFEGQALVGILNQDWLKKKLFYF